MVALTHRRRSSGTVAAAAALAAAFLAPIVEATPVPEPQASSTPTPCLAPGGGEASIQAILDTGVGATVNLCPSTTYVINNWVTFKAPNQEIRTVGYPTGTSRATILVNGTNQATAILGNGGGVNNIKIQNVIINGNRPALGMVSGGTALIEIGGSTTGQTINNCKITEPRGWSAIHYIEGNNLDCTGGVITNNEIGPAGNSPGGVQQLRKRDDGEYESETDAYQRFAREYSKRGWTKSFAMTYGSEIYANASTQPVDHEEVKRAKIAARQSGYTPGQWADGISLACRSTLVQNNAIIDPTDGGIVIFQSPGSTIQSNSVTSSTRNSMGGINMVDYYPFGGNFQDVQLVANKLVAQNSMLMKIGIGMGGNVWYGWNVSAQYPYYNNGTGRVYSNIFLSQTGGNFGYGISTAGMFKTSISSNVFRAATFGAAYSPQCGPYVPTPSAMVADMYGTSGTLQALTNMYTAIIFQICIMPLSLSSSSPSGSTFTTPQYTISSTSQYNKRSEEPELVSRSLDDSWYKRSSERSPRWQLRRRAVVQQSA